MTLRRGYEAFEADLREALGEAIQDDWTAHAVWSALANVAWYHWGRRYRVGYSFRAAGALIATLRGSGTYLDWYCQSPEAVVEPSLRRAMKKRGWLADELPDLCDEPGCLADASCVSRRRHTCYAHRVVYEEGTP